MSQLYKTITFTLIFFGLTAGLFPVMAQIKPLSGEDCGILGLSCSGSENAGTLRETIVLIVNLFLSLVGVIAAIYIMYAGFRYITSQGDEKETAAAKRMIMYAVLGLIVIGLAAVIVNFVIDGLSRS